MDDREWLERRRLTVGSSNAPAVCGCDPFKTSLDVYNEMALGIDQRENQPMRWGKKLEEVIAAAYTEHTGIELMIPTERLAYNEQFPWMHATLDRVAADGRIVELKTSRDAHEWGVCAEDVPEGYLIQVHHQMVVAGVEKADLAVLIAGSDFRIYPVEFNPLLAELVVLAEQEFHQLVQKRIPPDPDWDDVRTAKALDRMYSPDESERIVIAGEAAFWVEEFVRLRQEKTAAEKDIELLRGRLIGLLGHAGIGIMPDGSWLIRKQVTRHFGAREAYETTHNEFRIKHPKKVGNR